MLSNAASFEIGSYAVQADKQYSFDKIQKERGELFSKNTTLNTSSKEYYWLKTSIYNPYPNKEYYRLSLSPLLNYDLYFFDDATGKWARQQAGPAVPNGQRERGVVPLVLQGERENILYLKINVKDVRSYGYPIKPVIVLNKEIS